jgi:hypothetical protein
MRMRGIGVSFSRVWEYQEFRYWMMRKQLTMTAVLAQQWSVIASPTFTITNGSRPSICPTFGRFFTLLLSHQLTVYIADNFLGQ